MRETIVDRAYAKTFLPPRKEDGHKGDFGKLLVLGGSVGYTGAPYLAASAAVHSGCGLVYLGVPESIWAVEAQKCVSAMPFPLPETDGRLCLAALDKMQDKLKGCDVLALGPGLGRGKETEQLVHALLWQVKEPLVLDADGLNGQSLRAALPASTAVSWCSRGTGRALRCRTGGCSSTRAAARRSQRAGAGTC